MAGFGLLLVIVACAIAIVAGVSGVFYPAAWGCLLVPLMLAAVGTLLMFAGLLFEVG
jgi:hypothetical protein